MKLPVFRSLSDPKLPGDLVAGLTVWAVLVPEALAYASIAGVSPVVGLYAAPGALILYAAFGSSRQLVTVRRRRRPRCRRRSWATSPHKGRATTSS